MEQQKFKDEPSPLLKLFKLDNELSYFVIDDLIDNQKSTGDEYSEKDPTGAKKSVEKRCLQRALRRPLDSVCTDEEKYEYCGDHSSNFRMFLNCGGNEQYPDKIVMVKEFVDKHEGFFLDDDFVNDVYEFRVPEGPLIEFDPLYEIDLKETYNGVTPMEILLTFTYDCIRNYDKAEESLVSFHDRMNGIVRTRLFISKRFKLIEDALDPENVNYQNSVTGDTPLLYFLKLYINCFHRDIMRSTNRHDADYNDIPRADPTYIDRMRYVLIHTPMGGPINMKIFFNEVINLFIEKGADLGIKNKKGLNVLNFVEPYTENEDFDKFKRLLDETSLSIPLKYYKMGKNEVTMA